MATCRPSQRIDAPTSPATRLEAPIVGGHNDVEPAHRTGLDEYRTSPAAPLDDVDPGPGARLEVDDVMTLARSKYEGRPRRRTDDDSGAARRQQVGGMELTDLAMEHLHGEVAGGHGAGHSRHHRK